MGTNEHLIAPNVPKQIWTQKFGSWLHWITSVNNDPDAALVHSDSSSDPEKEVKAREKIDVEFQKAGARGLTLLFASGDNGVWDEGKPDASKFVPQWPASNPYVTGVGGTEFGT